MTTDAQEARRALHDPFVPGRSRRVAVVLGVAQALVLLAVIVLTPMGAGGFGWYDRFGLVLFGALVGWMLWRFARVRATPSESGLVVRNLMTTQTLEWAQIVAVRFGGGSPWVMLDLGDGETLAVMAVQRAEGPAAQVAASRLATLVALHSRTSRNG